MAAKIPGNGVESSGAFTVGAAGTASTLAGIPFFSDTSNKSMYTHDVSGTDSTAAGNTAFGFTAMDAITTGDDNVAIGENAATALTTGSNNVAIGKNAFAAATTAGRNICIGDGAGQAMGVDGGTSAHVFIGHNAGNDCTSNAYSIFIGGFAGDGHDTENHNLGIGYDALGGSVAGGEYNVAVGNYSLDALTSGDSNTAVGWNSGTAVTTGNENVIMGQGAAVALTEGSNNVCIGEYTAYNLTTGNYNTTIGNNNATDGVDAEHQITLGYGIGSNGDNNFTFGKAGNRVYNNFSSNATFTRSSDERKKQNIKDDNLGLDFINELRPVTYQWKPSNEFPKEWEDYNEENQMDTEVVMHGLIAQEVKSALDNAGIDTFGGWTENKDGMQNISREMFVFPLIKAVQELSAKVKALEEA